jgi:hypothetical protein
MNSTPLGVIPTSRVWGTPFIAYVDQPGLYSDGTAVAEDSDEGRRFAPPPGAQPPETLSHPGQHNERQH